MFASVPRLTEFPTEILEQILQHLPGQDVVKMEMISRRFQDLTRSSPILQYKRDLFSAGLVENPCSPCDFAQRRKACEEHERKWSDAGRVEKAIHELPEGSSLGVYPTILGRNLIALRNTQNVGGLTFLRFPPVTSVSPIERWRIPPLPFELRHFAVYPPDNILAVAEEKALSLSIHLLNLSDGSPYSTPPSNIITWDDPRQIGGVYVRSLAITSSRAVVRLHEGVWEEDYDGPEKLLVWDWKTRRLILNLPSEDRIPYIRNTTHVTVLDEFRMIIFTLECTTVPEFTLCDTLVPYGSPGNLQRFRLPPRYHGWFPHIHVDSGRCLGTPDRDRPLTTDPALAVFVMSLISPNQSRNLFIVRIQPLFEHAHSLGAGGYVPWDMWGRGVAVLDVPESVSAGGPYPLVQGPRVNFVCTGPTLGVDGTRPHLCTFDFSRRGWSVLPLLEERDGVERSVSFGDGRNFVLRGEDGMFEPWFHSMGSANFVCIAPFASGVVHIWELI